MGGDEGDDDEDDEFCSKASQPSPVSEFFAEISI